MAKAKKKSPVKKAAKAAPKKAAKPAAKKAAPKKAAAKKPAKKTALQKAAKPVKKPAAKTPAPKTASNAGAKTAAPAKAAAKKLPDFSSFMTPLDDRVLVRLKGTDRMTAGGLFIPDTVSDVSGNFEGVVVAVGRGHRSPKGRMRPMDLSLGDRVVFGQYAGSKIRLMDEDLVLLRESEVMGVIS